MDHGLREASKTAVALAEISTRIPASAIWLCAGLALDLGGCTLFRGPRAIPLTAQEARFLGLLLRAPGRFVGIGEVARGLTRPDGFEVNRHGVHQAVSALRRKLGTPSESARLLEGRRGCGYRLCIKGGREADDVPYDERAAITA